MPFPIIGQIKLFAGPFAPRGYAFCDGQLLNVAQSSALFAVLGTTYGGDGRTTFALPDLRGRGPVHAGQGPGLSPYRLGQRGGAAMVELREAELPSHTHPWRGVAAPADLSSPANNSLASSPTAGPGTGGAKVYGAAPAGVALAPESMDPAGGGRAHPNQQPFLGLNYVIAVQGVFPQRS